MPKRNVYFSEADVEIWDNLPDGSKSQLLRDFLLEHHEGISRENLTDREKEREFLRHQILVNQKELNYVNEQYYEYEGKSMYLEERVYDLQKEFESQFGAWSPDENLLIAADIWDVIYSEAEARVGAIFTSPSGDSQYRIQDAKKGKIMIERMDTPSPKPSTFTSLTIEKAVERLNRDGDGEKLALGQFMPVLAQECAAVFLHPNIRYEGNWLVFDRKDR
jgi:hypothetical protein|tara:strand:- start:231 stop:890 length:660 start_codon:yes stop_codon:yes gene_type:complete